jgi:hypothetical protein
MITRFITEVKTKFNPFSMRSRATRLFLSYLPPNARAMGMQINTTLLPRTSTEPNMLSVKFSTSSVPRAIVVPVASLFNNFADSRYLQKMERR